MYNSHRGIMPTQTANNCFAELLDRVRQEFDVQAGRATEHEQQLTAQVHEVEMIRRKLYELEAAQAAIKKQYEEEVTRLRHELESRGVPSHVGGPFHTAQLPPPSVGNGPSNLFGGITAGGAAPGGPGLAPPGSRGGRNPRSSPSPATPQQYSAAPYPRSPQAPPDTLNVGNSLGEFDPNRLPPHLKRDGSDWLAVFNPKVQRILDVDLVHTLNHTSIVCYVRFSFDGRFIATGCNRSAEIFDVDTGNCVAVLQDTSLPEDGDIYIRSVCFSPDGKYLVTGGEDKIINVWEIQSRTIKHQFTGHEQDIYSLDFARNGRLIASGSGDRTVRLWDIETNQQVILLLIDDGVTAVAISSDNRYVAAGSLDKSVRVWDVSTGFLVQRLEGEFGHIDSVYSVAFAPNGNTLVSGSLDKTIKIWELEPPPSRLMTGQGPRGGKCIKTFEGHKDFVLSVALTPDGQWVLSGSKDRGVQFWDPVTGMAQLMLQGHKNSVISIASSPTGKLFATGSGDLRTRIWRYDRYNGP